MKILKYTLSISLLFRESLGFIPLKRDIAINPLILKKNHEIYEHYNILGKYKSYFEPNVFSEIEKHSTFSIKDYTSQLKQDMGNSIVKMLSSGLPKVDNIGHKILHANNLFINDILNNHLLSHDTQKSIILASIKIAQHGDDMGSSLLQLYYNFVDYFL